MLFVLLWRLIKLRIMLKFTYFFLGADARAAIPFHSLNSHLRLCTQKIMLQPYYPLRCFKINLN